MVMKGRTQQAAGVSTMHHNVRIEFYNFVVMEGRAWPVGVLTSDPRIVEGAAPVPLLTYEEATELAFFGATVLHPLAMQPALQSRSLAVRVKNSYNRRAL